MLKRFAKLLQLEQLQQWAILHLGEQNEHDFGARDGQLTLMWSLCTNKEPEADAKIAKTEGLIQSPVQSMPDGDVRADISKTLLR